MKQKHGIDSQSGFWVKLIGVLVAVGIVVVLVFGGLQNVLSQITALQMQLDTKNNELVEVTSELENANLELSALMSNSNDTEDDSASIIDKLHPLQSKVNELRSALALAQSQREDTVRQLRLKDNEVAEAESKIATLDLELSDARDQLTATQIELSTKTTFCEDESVYAKWLNRNSIDFDLLCQPLLPRTIELDDDNSIFVRIDLKRFKVASGKDLVRFRIHFAIDHGRLEINEVGSRWSRKLSDSGGRNLRDIVISTKEEVIEIEITSVGFRSAEFDLALWPSS